MIVALGPAWAARSLLMLVAGFCAAELVGLAAGFGSLRRTLFALVNMAVCAIGFWSAAQVWPVFVGAAAFNWVLLVLVARPIAPSTLRIAAFFPILIAVVDTAMLASDPTRWAKALGLLALWFAVGVQDMVAMRVGTAWPYGRLLPEFSPRKTWSGSVAGFGAGTITLLAANQILALGFRPFEPPTLMLAAQLGDLFFSGVKRGFGVKDFSQFLGSKGGVLDRVDSLIFCLIAAGLQTH